MTQPEPVALRAVVPSDLDVFHRQQLEPEAIRMAAFVARDRTDRAVFQAHWEQILQAPRTTNRTILAQGQVAGHIACFPRDGQLEVAYWLGRESWGRGLATRALRLMLELVPDRPLLARAATDNRASLRVLEKCGFKIVGTDRGFAPGRGEDIEETLLRLDPEPARA